MIHSVKTESGKLLCYFQGVKQFFNFSFGLEIARGIIYNYRDILRNPLNIFGVLFKRLNWSLVLFLVGYVGMYRVSSTTFC